MTDITTELKEFADLKFDRALARKNLREKAEAQLAVTHAGGLFKATPILISFLSSLPTDVVYLEDAYLNPIKCDRITLLNSLIEAYQFAMNQWHTEFEISNSIRKGSNV